MTQSRKSLWAALFLGILALFLTLGGRESTERALPGAQLVGGQRAAQATPLTAPIETAGIADPRGPTGHGRMETGTRVRVQVFTGESTLADSAPVPDIAFELHRALGQPEPGAGFHSAVTFLDPSASPIAVGRTDASGVSHLEIAESQLDRGGAGLPLLLVRVVEPGYQQRVGHPKTWRAGADASVELRVMAARGATARGRIVDSAGRARSAEVGVRHWIQAGKQRRLESELSVRPLVQGRFEIDFPETRLDRVLVADGGVWGTGALHGVHLSLEDPPRDLVVVLQGEGRMRGQVLHSDDRPAAELELLVGLVDFHDGIGGLIASPFKEAELQVLGLGRSWVELRSDARGRFDVQGLTPGSYLVCARTIDGASWEYDRPLALEPVPADGRELLLRYTQPHIAVRLAHADGSPWTGALGEQLTETVYGPDERWPAEPRISAFASVPDGGAGAARVEPLEGRVTPHGEVVFDVREGRRYRVSAHGGGFLGELHDVEIPSGAGRVELELRAPPHRENGAVSVRVLHDSLELRSKEDGAPPFDVYLESLDSAAILLRTHRDLNSSPIVLEAPPGTYRLVVEGTAHSAPFYDSNRGLLLQARILGRAEAEVVIFEGATSELSMEIGVGARIQLSLEGMATEADAQAIYREHRWSREDGFEDERARLASFAKVELQRPGRRPEPVLHSEPWGDGSDGRLQLNPDWRLGETDLSEVLPPGAYTILARMPGGREARAKVVLGAGQTTSVVLAF